MRHRLFCSHQSFTKDIGRFVCELGYYGGQPLIGNCLECVRRGDNSPAAKASFDARADRAHPPMRSRVSGCCDRADQA